MTLRKSFQTALVAFFFVAFQSGLFAQDELKQWHTKDAADGFYGVSSEKALELLKGRKSSKVRVAIIDSGVDVDHEDLKKNIWVNPKEIAGNGKDDDGNGYIDDINGWNFMGNSKGVNLEHANLEMTRIYRKLAPRFAEVKDAKSVAKDKADYALFQEVSKKVNAKLEEANGQYGQLSVFVPMYMNADSIATVALGANYTLEAVAKWNTSNSDENAKAKALLSGLMQDPSFDKASLMKYYEYLQHQVMYHYNPQFDDRAQIGDNADNTTDRLYGNGAVSASQADHGTHVSGIVGAVRGNSLGMDGIAPNVELMVLRAVPNGDEFDKDIANAIRYAADNGAQIINMSFGKGYSPQLEAVHQAIRYAEEKGVLMIHAAGNDSENIDKGANFPHPNYSFQKTPCSTWITVGASAHTGDENLVGVFSNYGKKKVDVFAPGVRIWSTKPGSIYEFEDGTSMAAPVVTGVAALLKSYFPELTGVQLKALLLSTARTYPKLKVLLPDASYSGKKLTSLGKISATGGVVNALDAAKRALEMYP